MANIISLEQWKSEREQRRIFPQLQQAAKLRATARTLVLAAEVIEQEACGSIDYDVMAGEKIATLEAMHNA